METPPRELPVVTDHPALNLANTVDDPLGPGRHDHIATYPDLLLWARRTELLRPADAEHLLALGERHPRRAAAAVRRAADLRDALNETFGAFVDGTDPNPGWSRLRRHVTEAVDRSHLGDTGPAWDLTEPVAPLWPVAAAAHELLLGDEIGRLKRCGYCPWLFLDRSKNGSRRWCSMEDCGTQAKIVRYVAKRRAAKAG